ncbi:hypothetical protein [Dinghuibacter silviterrae]|uniref:Uncharacterized protein n=1 Tax=Dinghuibacter silviterrae TaxID=1539049 RepID=A0A4R8DHQ1_9BACT|nr:hypothetical protein [Dinghuibacter silviterrae]TDW96988.1 hypothetical protein EDB95_4824 [Dinghuibacter silviterrae]
MIKLLTDLPWTTIGEILIYLVSALLLVYFTVISATDLQMIKSKVLRDRDAEILQYYFLPTASLTIQAVAEVSIIVGSNTGLIVGLTLANLVLESKVNIEPDTENTIAVSYVPFIFANDEVDVTTNDLGLLQNVAFTSDDRVTSVVAEIADLPKALLGRGAEMRDSERIEQVTEPTIYRKETFKNTFIITAGEMETGSFKRQWTLRTDGLAFGQDNQLQLVLEASFATGRKNGLKADVYNGLLTRPLVKRTIPISVTQVNGPRLLTGNTFNITALVPDVSTVLTVPMKRYFFVKVKSNPAFSNGLLQKMHLEKPSEAEAFISIPVRLLKAIFSIPSELFHFRITRLQEQNALETELKKARALQDNTAAPQRPGPLAAADQPTTPPEIQDGTKFGNLPSPPGKTGSIRNAAGPMKLMARMAKGASAALGAPKVPCQWYSKFNGIWGYYGNKTANTCTAAAAAHLIISWKAVNNPANVALPLVSAVLDAYTKAGGTADGLSIFNMLFYWQDKGIGGDIVGDFQKVKANDFDTLKMATFWYGGSLVSLNLPGTIQDDAASTRWSIPAGDPPGKSLHTVTVLGYDTDDTIFAVSWGRIVTIDRSFYEKYNQETWVAISTTDWLNGEVSPSDATEEALEQQITTFSQQV